MFTRITALAAAVIMVATAARAQEKLGSAEPEAPARPGWVFTPSFGFAETYDDNITLFGRGDAENENNDFVSSYNGRAKLTYSARHTQVSAAYGGSFLTYRTFTLFNRWDQRLDFDLRRAENARLTWYAHVNGATVPSTESVEFNGVPFSHTGAKTIDGRIGFAYRLSGRNVITSAVQYQRAAFERPVDLGQFLRGGRAASSISTFRRSVNSRTNVGGDYVYQRSQVSGDRDESSTHTAEAAIDYQLSPAWTVTAGAGFSFLEANVIAAAKTAPALRAVLNRSVNRTNFHVGYMQGILPSFGLGGSVLTREVGVGYFTPLFHSRYFFTDHSAVFRDDAPAIELPGQLKLRSLRTSSSIGWSPQRWVRIEGFYSRLAQSSLVASGRLDRNRLGFQIVTSKPMRMQ